MNLDGKYDIDWWHLDDRFSVCTWRLQMLWAMRCTERHAALSFNPWIKLIRLRAFVQKNSELSQKEVL